MTIPSRRPPLSAAIPLTLLMMTVMANPDIREMVGTRDGSFKYHGGKTVPVRNSNHLLHKYPECMGLKTGYTVAAGRCLVCGARGNGRVVLAVVLGSTMDGIWSDSESLLKWGLADSQTIATRN